jgi:hypothetical protein
MAEVKITWFKPKGLWRKRLTGNDKEISLYFKYPNTVKGKELAIAAFLKKKDELTGEKDRRKYLEFARTEIDKVKRYLESYDRENALLPLIVQFLPDCEITHEMNELKKVHRLGLLDKMPGSPEEKELIEILGVDWLTSCWQLPVIWRQRVRILDNVKESLLIGHWLEKYKANAQLPYRLKGDSIYAKINHIRPFEAFIDGKNLIHSIKNRTLDEYETFLNQSPNKKDPSRKLSRPTKITYFSAFAQFCQFLSDEEELEFKYPSGFKKSIIRFRSDVSTGSKKLIDAKNLWSKQEFNDALKSLPTAQNIWILLALNCGFRNSNLDAILWDDLKGNRLIHQRPKHDQKENAPIVNYKIWDRTLDLISKLPKRSEFMLTRPDGKRLKDPDTKVKGVPRPYDSVAHWWSKNRAKYNVKNLNFLRKTGSTFINDIDPGVRPIYLGNSHTEIEDISYTFADAKINKKLDKCTDKMGKHFLG